MSLRQKARLVEVSTNAQSLSSVHLPPAFSKTPAQSRTGSPTSSLVRRAGRTRTRNVLFSIPHTVGKYELMKACTVLHLETSGTQAQLRGRIANHINANYKLEHYLTKEMRGWWLTQHASDPKMAKREWILPGASEKIVFQGVHGKERQFGSASVAKKKEVELAPSVSGLTLKEETFDRLVLLDDDDEKSEPVATTTDTGFPKSVAEDYQHNTITLDFQEENDAHDIESPTGTIQLNWDTLRAGEDTFNLSDVVNKIQTAPNPEIDIPPFQHTSPTYGLENHSMHPLPSFPTNDASVSWKEFEQHKQAHMAEMNELTMMLKVLADEMRDIDDVLLEQSAEILHNKAEISQLEKMASSACSQTADQRNILYTAAQQIEQFQRESMQYRKSKHIGDVSPQKMESDKTRYGHPIRGSPESRPQFHSDNFILLKARFQGLQRTTADALETVKRNHKRLNVTIAGIQMTDGVSPTEDAEAILKRLNFRPGSPFAAWRRYGEREDGVPFDPSQPPFLIIRFNSEFIVMDLLKTFNAFRNRFPDRKAPFKIMKDLTKNQVLEAKKVNEIILQWRKTDGRDYRNRDGVIYLFENGVRVRKVAPGEGPLQNNMLPAVSQSYVNKPYNTFQNHTPVSAHPGSFARALPPSLSQVNNQPTMKQYDTTNYDYSNARSLPRPIIAFNHASPNPGAIGYSQPLPQRLQHTEPGYQHHFRQSYGSWCPPAVAMSQRGFR